MKAKPTKRKQRVKPKKIYTYEMICSFTLQYSFTESDVEPDSEGGKGDFNPTEKALRSLEKELTDALGSNYYISDLEAYAESDDLLGVLEEEPPLPDAPQPNTRRPMTKKTPPKTFEAKRTFSLRRDASVGSGTRTIERVFGLPEGSVCLQLPSGRRARADKKIGALLSDFGW